MAKTFGWSIEDMRHTPTDIIYGQYKRIIDWKQKNPEIQCPFLKVKK